MTKKEKLINWARDKFERDPNGDVTLLYREVKYHDDNYGTPYTAIKIKHCYNVNNLLEVLEFYSDRLVSIEYEKPLPHEEFYECYLDEYNTTKELLEKYSIDMEDMCIFNYYWKSSEDIKYFEES